LKRRVAAKNFIRYSWLAAFMAIMLLCPLSSSGISNNPAVKAGDCRGCHGQDQVLPADHPETKGQSLSDCRNCHKKPESSLKGKMSLSHTHNLAGVACADCHGPGEPSAPVVKDQCLACHGSGPEVAGLTAEQKPNPHDSPHYGPDQDCDLCHHLHQKSENLCNQCHEFNLVVP